MKLAIVIVHYNTSDDLNRCLDSIARHPPAHEHAVVVVDNASVDPALQGVRAAHPEVHWVLNAENLGYARGANQGMNAVTAQYYLVLNPDIVVEPDALQTLIVCADAHPRAGIIGPQLLNEDGSIQDSCRRFYTFRTLLLRRTFLGKIFRRTRTVDRHLMRDFDHRSMRPVDWVLGGCLLARRSAVERTGPMDERFFLYFEDVDWCYRMWQAGFEVLYVPDARFLHRHRRDSAKGAFHRSFWLHLGSLISFYEKWGMLVFLLKKWRGPLAVLSRWVVDMTALATAFVGAYGLRRLLNRWFSEPLYPLAEYRPLLFFAGLLATLSFLISGRYRSQRHLLTSTFLNHLQQIGTVSVLLLASTYLSHQQVFSRAVLLLFVPLFVFTTALGEDLFRALRRWLERGHLSLERTLLVGPQEALREWLRAAGDPHLSGIDPVGYLAEPGSAGAPPLRGGELPWLGTQEEILAVVEKYRIGQVVFWDKPRGTAFLRSLAQLRRQRIRLRWHIEEVWLLAAGARAEPFGRDLSAVLEPPGGSIFWLALRRMLNLAAGLVLAFFSAVPFLWFRIMRLRSGRGALRAVACSRGWTAPSPLRMACTAKGRVLPLWWQWPCAMALLAGRLDLWGERLISDPAPQAADSPAALIEFWRADRMRCGLTGRWALAAHRLPADMQTEVAVAVAGRADRQAPAQAGRLPFSFAEVLLMIRKTMRSLLLEPGGLGCLPIAHPNSPPERSQSRKDREVL